MEGFSGKDKKHYRALVKKAEDAFHNKRYLESFLIQACLIESVVRVYAEVKLKGFYGGSPIFHNKLRNIIGFAQLIDMLFLVQKIPSKLYEDLSLYKKKRNEVVHNILKYGAKNRKLTQSIKSAYRTGSDMKGLIVDDIVHSNKSGETLAALAAEQEVFLKEHFIKVEKAFGRQVTPQVKKLEDDFAKIFGEKETKKYFQIKKMRKISGLTKKEKDSAKKK